jgi:hypothetical protein
MTIQTIQVCDGCGDHRELKVGDDQGKAGWRMVDQNTHLCGVCIRTALRNKYTSLDDNTRRKDDHEQDQELEVRQATQSGS